MQLYLSLAVFAVACLTNPVLSQRWVRQQQRAQYCVTPENYYGSCVTLSNCPQIVNIFQNVYEREAQQYIIYSQRACGTRSINGDPVVCCTRPLILSQTTVRPQRQTPRQPQRPFQPQTSTSIIFPATRQTNTRNPFLNPITRAPVPEPLPTDAPTRAPTTAPTRAPTTTPTRIPSIVTEGPSTDGDLVDNEARSCNDPDNREGTCMPIRDCKYLVDELQTKHSDPIFARFLRASNIICGGTATNICCPYMDDQRPNATLSNDQINIPRSLPTEDDVCGFTKSPFKRVVGGQASGKGAWPWIALIGYNDELSPSPFKCGGTLITARHVITAAHCLKNDLSFVRLGEHDLSTDSETSHVDIRVVRSERNPNYNKRNGHSDIAILYLERNVEFTELISPICLLTTSELRKQSYVRYNPFVVGWGKTMEGGNSAAVLQEIQIPVYDNEVCRDSYRKQNRLFTENQFDEAVLCAGVLTGGMDTCQGDSGGPLMIPENYKERVRFYLIGVVSYGIGCARPNIPGVYSSIQYFMDWIIQQVADTP